MEMMTKELAPRRSLLRQRRSSSMLRSLADTARHVAVIISTEAVRVVDNRSREEYIRHFLPVRWLI